MTTPLAKGVIMQKMDETVVTKIATFFFQYSALQIKKGRVFIGPTNDPPGIFYIQQGIAKEYVISKNGNEITLNLYKNHTFVPMSWALTNIPNVHFFEAMEIYR